MPKNLKRYYQAWILRKKGLKLREIGEIMGLSKERVRYMASYLDFMIKNKFLKLPKEIRKLKQILSCKKSIKKIFYINFF